MKLRRFYIREKFVHIKVYKDMFFFYVFFELYKEFYYILFFIII